MEAQEKEWAYFDEKKGQWITQVSLSELDALK